MQKRVCAVLVTYNRLNCLKKVIQGLDSQSYKLSGIFIFDNQSTDNTDSYLLANGFNKIESETEEIQDGKYFFRNNENIGGAGGFSKAIDLINKLSDFDYIWIMDDDVYPENNCLEKLMGQLEKQNVQAVIPNRTDQNYEDNACIGIDFSDFRKFWTWWRKKYASKPLNKEVYVVKDMAFEGPLLEKRLIDKVGIPNPGFFLEYDDSDYAQRILKYTNIIFVTGAVLHRQLAKKSNSNKKGMEPYNWRFYYLIRNNIIFDKKYGKNWGVKHISPNLLMLHHIALSIRDHHLKNNLPIILKAWTDGRHNRMGKRVNPNY
ncbi:glycosyltransferase family 2 protein (plasmid) [Lactiplantibacillus plantarum]|uniref:glycosyltransferase family 2 protein n=1 Tax=Lactobacillaceae TaxID=33958 RepID=UPI003523D4E0